MTHTLLEGALLSALIVTGFNGTTHLSDSILSEPSTDPVTEEIQYQVPVPPPVLAEVEPIAQTRTANNTEIQCLARNVYFEARGEGQRGMQAVAHVTMNRVQSRQFRRTICGVVYQPSQFSWTRRPSTPRGDLWQQSLNVARAVYNRLDSDDITHGATYFHARSARPNWAARFRRTISIGAHVFYRP